MPNKKNIKSSKQPLSTGSKKSGIVLGVVFVLSFFLFVFKHNFRLVSPTQESNQLPKSSDIKGDFLVFSTDNHNFDRRPVRWWAVSTNDGNIQEVDSSDSLFTVKNPTPTIFKKPLTDQVISPCKGHVLASNDQTGEYLYEEVWDNVPGSMSGENTKSICLFNQKKNMVTYSQNFSVSQEVAGVDVDFENRLIKFSNFYHPDSVTNFKYIDSVKPPFTIKNFESIGSLGNKRSEIENEFQKKGLMILVRKNDEDPGRDLILFSLSDQKVIKAKPFHEIIPNSAKDTHLYFEDFYPENNAALLLHANGPLQDWCYYTFDFASFTAHKVVCHNTFYEEYGLTSLEDFIQVQYEKKLNL